MTKHITYFIFALAAIVALTSAITNGNQSPYGKTGSPKDGGDCTFCHTGTPVNDSFISTNIPASGYISGKTYTITVTAKRQGINKFGFELTAEDNLHNKTGNFVITNSTETKMVGDEVSHSGLGTSGTNGQKIWSVDWKAPVKGTGQVTFYSAVNAANGDGGIGGDIIILSSFAVQENPANAVSIAAENKKAVLFPTIAKNKITIKTPEKITSAGIYDTGGRKVLKVDNQQYRTTEIDISKLQSGVYFVHIISGDIKTVLKFIKNN